jgi:hypothetical protein
MRRFLSLIFASALLISSCSATPQDGNNGADAGGDVGVDADTSDDAQGDTAPECSASETLCGNGCVDTTTSDVHCGACDEACDPTGNGYMTVCVQSACDPTDTCAEGFVDLNDDDSDGCECEITDAMDPPGDGDDTNCDGLDGNRSAALFVKAGASGDGRTAATPMGSLSTALNDVAADGTFSQILVAQGSYPPFSLVSDVILAGGFSGDFQDHDPSSYETVIERMDDATGAGDLTTVAAENVEHTRVVSMRILASDAVDPGASTVALHARNSVLDLRALTLGGGQAAAGADGHEVTGAASCIPYAGGDGADSDSFNPCARPQETNATSGDSGEPSSTGGVGGTGGAHECSVNCSEAMAGGNADDGGAGADGTDGAPPTSGVGVIDNGFWAPATSTPAETGYRGAGGGGGGAGGNCAANTAFFSEGGKGADGGDGGCGGKAGNNGEPGGASILLLSVGSTITLTDLTGLPGTGGNGGAGTGGGDGEAGLEPGQPEAVPGDGNGGSGGFGGAGGDGGDGAGGCGGPAYGVAFDSASAITGELDVPAGETFAPGQPGDGANNAPAGCDGVASSEEAF